MTAVTATMQSKYSAISTTLQPDSRTIVAQLGVLQWITVTDELAEIDITRSGVNGPQTFQIYLIRSEDGIWRVDGM